MECHGILVQAQSKLLLTISGLYLVLLHIYAFVQIIPSAQERCCFIYIYINIYIYKDPSSSLLKRDMKDLRSTWSKVYELIGVEEDYQNFGRQREAYTLDRVGKGTWNGAAHEGT